MDDKYIVDRAIDQGEDYCKKAGKKFLPIFTDVIWEQDVPDIAEMLRKCDVKQFGVSVCQAQFQRLMYNLEENGWLYAGTKLFVIARTVGYDGEVMYEDKRYVAVFEDSVRKEISHD